MNQRQTLLLLLVTGIALFFTAAVAEPTLKLWFIDNFSQQPKGVGSHIHMHFIPEGYPKATSDYAEHQFWYLNNTYVGGVEVIALPPEVASAKGLPGFYFINNHFVGMERIFHCTKAFLEPPQFVGAFDYNRISGGGESTRHASMAGKA